MPEVLLKLCKQASIKMDAKYIEEKSQEIYNEHFANKNPTDSLFVAIVLMKHLYEQIDFDEDTARNPSIRNMFSSERLPGYT